MRYLIFFLAMLVSTPALASASVSLVSEVFVERVVEKDGKRVVALEAPKVVVPGDRLLVVLSYKNGGAQPATDFIVTNPIPQSVAYESAEGQGAQVSVDGGKNWGQLAALKIRQADGTDRAAVGADVTHIRWTFPQAIPSGQAGKLSFRGIVK